MGARRNALAERKVDEGGHGSRQLKVEPGKLKERSGWQSDRVSECVIATGIEAEPCETVCARRRARVERRA